MIYQVILRRKGDPVWIEDSILDFYKVVKTLPSLISRYCKTKMESQRNFINQSLNSLNSLNS